MLMSADTDVVMRARQKRINRKQRRVEPQSLIILIKAFIHFVGAISCTFRFSVVIVRHPWLSFIIYFDKESQATASRLFAMLGSESITETPSASILECPYGFKGNRKSASSSHIRLQHRNSYLPAIISSIVTI